MNVTELALTKRTVTTVLLLLALGAGAATYFTLPRQEDPGFTVRVAVVTAFYPGATPQEVEKLVTDPLEEEIEEIPQVEFIESESRHGASVIRVEVQDKYTDIEPIWIELRERVQAATSRLPEGTAGPIVNDNYGDRYSTVVAMTGEDFSYAELETLSEEVRKRLLGLENVGKVQVDGIPEKRVFVEYDRARLSALGLSTGQLTRILRSRNVTMDGGFVQTERERIGLQPSGSFDSVEQIRAMTFRLPGSDELVALRDVATVTRGYADPPTRTVSYNGQRAVSIGVSMADGGKITQLGPRVLNALDEMKHSLPAGLDFHTVSYRASVVDSLVSEFTGSLLQGILAVLAVLLLFLGVRTGLIVASAIPITVVGSLLFMAALGVSLNKMSLTALIIALGLLVDNAVVISESILVQMREGKSAFSAAIDSAKELRFPLLVASLTTAAALLPTYLANHAVAEYTSAIFEVVSIALLLSWGLSLTVMPMLCFLYLKVEGSDEAATSANRSADPAAKPTADDAGTTWWNPATWTTAAANGASGSSAGGALDGPAGAAEGEDGGEYDTPFYRWYRGLLLGLVRHRWVALGIAVAVLGGALWTATLLPEQFIPRKKETLFNAHLEMPDGTPFERTQAVIQDLESFMRDSLQVPTGQENPLWAVPRIDETEFQQQGVVNWASWIGSGAPRYLLSYNPEQPRPNYAYMLVNTTSHDVQASIFRRMNAFADQRYPEATLRLQKLENGPAVPYPIEVRLSGPDRETLQHIAGRVKQRLRDEPGMTHVGDNWGQQLKQLRVDVNDAQAQRAGLTSEDVGLSVRTSLTGVPLTHFHEGNDRVPVVLRSDQAATRDVGSLSGIDVYAQSTGQNVPLTQVADLRLDFDASKVQRRDRIRTITVRGDLKPTAPGVTPVSVVQSIEPWLQEQSQTWPQGYGFEIGGEPEQSSSAQNSIREKMPYAVLIIVLLLVAQFNAIREPIIVLLTLPFALIGVVAGLFLTQLPLDFMGLMGTIALFGIVINNAVVLLDRIEIEMDDFGRDPPEAVLEASQRRLRPILLTTATTIGGLLPLWFTGDVMFTPMAVGMIFGLLVSTVLTLGLVPTLYSIFHGLDFGGLSAATMGGASTGGDAANRASPGDGESPPARGSDDGADVPESSPMS